MSTVRLNSPTTGIAAADAQAPGVSLVESNEPLLSIPGGATAVPVFIGTFRTLAGDKLTSTECIEVKSLFDFNRRFGSSQLVSVLVIGNSTQASVTVYLTMALGSLSLQAYFDNGGGRCFILPTSDDFTKVAAAIARQPQISLICSTERRVAANGNAELDPVYDALGSLLDKTGAPFLIADSPDGVRRPATVAQRTAVYFPGIETTYTARPSDAFIRVDRKTLAEIKLEDPALYKQISAAVDLKLAAEVPTVYLKASPAIAGVYCRTDREQGVWKAPAGVTLNGVRDVHSHVTGQVQMQLMKNRINALKTFPGEGVKVWGTRTMVMPQTPLWLHVPVSRLFDAAARDIQRAMQFAVFMPNNESTWNTVRSAIDNYLHKLWRDGGLNGRTPAEAYYVQVGLGVSMTLEEVVAGQMIVKVGIAPLRPLEFIDLVFSQVLSDA